MAPTRFHRDRFSDRADYYSGQAVRALDAARMAKEPQARASLYRIAEAWQTLAHICRTAEETTEEMPSVLSILPMVEDSEEGGRRDSRR